MIDKKYKKIKETEYKMSEGKEKKICMCMSEKGNKRNVMRSKDHLWSAARTP